MRVICAAKVASLLERALTVGRKFRESLLTEAALCVHAVLESIILGLAVRPPVALVAHVMCGAVRARGAREHHPWPCGAFVRDFFFVLCVNAVTISMGLAAGRKRRTRLSIVAKRCVACSTARARR